MELHALEPRSEAVVELVRLAERERELRARVDEVGRAARGAGAELVDAREALVELERAGSGQQPRTKAEDRLAAAEREAAAPWPQRRQGAERAALDGTHAIQRHIAANFDAIVAELEENGAAAAEQVNHAAELFLDATTRRAEAERTLIGVVALVRRMGPGDVSRSAADEAVQAIRSFIQRGGERAPTLGIAEPVAV